MVKKLLILLILFIHGISYSQDIFPLHNAKWTGVYMTGDTPENLEKTCFSYIVRGDTVVDNITRSKCYYIPDINKTDTLLIGYFHVVDSIVYFQVHENEDGSYSQGLYSFCPRYNLDYPLYDFSLKEGNIFNTCWNDVEVTSIEQVEFGGKMQKKITFNNDSTTCWIGGMGSNRGFFFANEEVPTSSDRFSDEICFSVNDTVLYMNPAYLECPVSQLSSIQEISPNRLTIYPNPTKSTITVQAGQPLSSIRIYDISGILALERVCNGKLYALINIQTLSSGIYFVRCISQTGNMQLKKIIINK